MGINNSNYKKGHYDRKIFNKTKPKYKFYFIILILLLAGAIMIGHGARMIYQGVYHQSSSYTPNMFDIFFDWFILIILGIFVLTISLQMFYSRYTKKSNYYRYYWH